MELMRGGPGFSACTVGYSNCGQGYSGFSVATLSQ